MSDDKRCTTEYRELISGYLDGDLDADERAYLLAHLATCADCRETLESYRRIGGQIRALPRAVPPPELREAIYAETVQSPSRKVYLLSSRLGYSVAALAAVLLIFVVAVYLLINGYQRTIDPEVVGSQPGNGVLWQLTRPVEISFNKEMDRESVEAALSIVPASEKDRLSVSWDGNTVILGENQSLHPATSYTILITTNAQDKWGKNLGSEFRLQFETSETFALVTPEPVSTPTPTAEPTVTPTATPDEPTPTSDTDAPAPPAPTGTVTEAPQIEPTPPASSATATPPPAPTADNSNQPPTNTAPTATPDDVPPPPTEEPAPEPTATPTATPRPTSTPAPTWTPRPIPSATPTEEPPTATATATEPLPTATPDTIPVVGPFGNVYWGNEIVLERLGTPVAAANSITGVELDFQHGAMLSRSDTNQTYVFESATGVWSVLPSTTDATSSEPAPVPDTWIPGGSLGALWATEPWIQSSLGYALAPSGSVFDSRVQRFEHGTMLMSSSGQIYVLYEADGTWELYPDPGP